MASFNGKVIDGRLNLRSTCSTSSSSPIQIPNGTSIVVETVSGQHAWFATSYGGHDGYVVAEFVAISSDGGTCTVSTSSGSLNIRKTPSTSAAVLFTAAKNSTLRLLDIDSVNGWFRVSSSEGTGWASSDYLIIVTEPDGSTGGGTGGDSGSGGGTGVNTATWEQVLANNGVYRKESSSSAVCEGVKTLQRYLIAIGWGRAAVLGTSSDLTVDGNFGSKTETAVKNFQYECELTQDGVVGVQTATKLNAYHDDPNFTTQKYHPLSDSEWSYNGLPSWVDEQSVCARLICAEHSRNDSDYSVAHEDARAGIAKVLRNRKNSSAYFNEVDGKEKYSSIIFGSGQFSPATGSSSSRKMARFARRGTSNSVPWQQAILYASKLVNNQTITRASNVTNHLYFNGYTSSWTTSGKKDIVYYPPASTNRFTAFFNR